MPRRLPLLIAMVATLAIVACSSTPLAPPLTDPKEILLQSVTGLQNVKTVQLKGTFGGSFTAPQMGNIDLSTIKFEAAVDVANKKTRLTVDAPTLMGTSVDLIVLPDSVYVKLLGPFGALAGLDASGKYTQFPVDATTTSDTTDPLKAIEELRKQLDELPTAPEKLADERCGDTDCYHVRIAMTAADLQALGGDASASVGNVSFDIWSRKNDLRPAKLAFSADAAGQGTVTGTFDVTYDQNLDISAPAADQVAPAP